MKLYTLILTTVFIATASMHGVDENSSLIIASHGGLPKVQQLPLDCQVNNGLIVDDPSDSTQQTLILKHPDQLRTAMNIKNRNLSAAKCMGSVGICLGAICCLPCLVLECIRDYCCPTINIHVHQNTNQ